MKKIFFFTILLCFSLHLSAQNTEGVQFIHEDFDKALAEAKVKNKILFMDAYTTWCGPCKLMTKNTFTDSTVATFYNKDFVNLKMDMESGEGPTLVAKYAITAYPSLLFINGQGEIIHKALGFHDPEQFIALGKTALEGSQTLSSWTARYDKGERSPEFLKEYTAKLAEAYDKRKLAVAEAYMALQKDWTTPENLEFIYKNTEGVEGKFFPYLIQNKKAFEKVSNSAEIDTKIQDILVERIFNPKNIPSLGYADSLIQLVYGKNSDRMMKKYRLDHARMQGDRTGFAEAAIQYFKKYSNDASELNEIANIFFEQIDDSKQLKKAADWAKKASKLEKNTNIHLTTLANLYSKLNKKSKAIKAAEMAIYVGETNGEDTKEAQTLLDTLKSTEKVENKK